MSVFQNMLCSYMPNYELQFYSSGNSKPIDKFLAKTNKPTRAKIFRGLNLLEKYGPMIGMPHVKKIDHVLYELRIRGKEEVRVLFITQLRIIYFLHIFKKKTQKIPANEINTAHQRLTYL